MKLVKRKRTNRIEKRVRIVTPPTKHGKPHGRHLHGHTMSDKGGHTVVNYEKAAVYSIRGMFSLRPKI